MTDKMVLFAVDFTVKTGDLEFKDSLLLAARDKKEAKSAFLRLTHNVTGIKGVYGDSGRNILYDMSQSTLAVGKITPYSS